MSDMEELAKTYDLTWSGKVNLALWPIISAIIPFFHPIMLYINQQQLQSRLRERPDEFVMLVLVELVFVINGIWVFRTRPFFIRQISISQSGVIEIDTPKGSHAFQSSEIQKIHTHPFTHYIFFTTTKGTFLLESNSLEKFDDFLLTIHTLNPEAKFTGTIKVPADYDTQ